MTALPVRAPATTACVLGVGAATALCAFAATQSSRGALLLATIALAPYAVLAVPHVRRVLLVAVVVDVFLQWDVNFGYRAEAGELGAEGGLGVSVTTVALAGLYAHWAVTSIKHGTGAAPLRLAAARPLLLYVTVSGLSVFVARDAVLGGYYLVLLLQTLLLFIYVASTVRTSGDVVFILAALMLGLVLEGALMFLEFGTGASSSAFGMSLGPATSDAVDGASRVSGTLGSPNTAATVITLALPAALGLLLAPLDRRVRGLALVALVVGVPALVLTGSRGGWIAFILSCTAVGAVMLRRRLVAAGAVARLTLVIVVLLLPLAGLVAQRLSEADPASARSRLPLAHLALDMIEDKPLLGVGLNNMVLSIPEYAGPDYTQDWLYVVHNKYLLVASEAGLLALAAFLWFLAATARRGVLSLRFGDDVTSPIAAGLLAGVLGSVVLMNSEIYAGRAPVQTLWLIAALLGAMAAMTRVPSASSPGDGSR